MSATEGFSAHWFDGISSRARDVVARLEVIDRRLSLVLTEADVQVLVTHAFDAPTVWRSAQATERLEQARKTPVAVDLRANGSLQVDALVWQCAWDEARARGRAAQASGSSIGWAERMTISWPVLGVSALLILSALFAAYRWGTPWAAEQLARWMPLGMEQSMTRAALRELDVRVFAPSKLSAQRQAELRERFEALLRARTPQLDRYRHYRPEFRLEFRDAAPRSGGQRGLRANALAFPGGTMLVTDGLVELAADRGLSDDALLGVIAHEVGHVVHRHGSRAVIEQGILNGVMGIALGDVSGILTTGAAVLQGLQYSRERETEADCFAIRLMQNAQLPTAPMADLLVALSDPKAEPPRSRASAASPAAATPPAVSTLPAASSAEPVIAKPEPRHAPDWLSTHPDTAERAQRLREGSLAGCGV